jgi:cysteine sulfinate desulfinase/cysteine desulfurase-like protein
MGIDPVLARGAITFSFSAASRAEEVDAVVEALPGVVRRLREISPLTPSRFRDSPRTDG